MDYIQDKYGREVQVGDQIVYPKWGELAIGKVHSFTAGNNPRVLLRKFYDETFSGKPIAVIRGFIKLEQL